MGMILTGQVMHRRLFPKENAFRYGIYYLALKLKDLPSSMGVFLGINRPGLVAFHNRDHGERDGSNLQEWAERILQAENLQAAAHDVTLVCMPRVFGYVFNPVSFWLCHDAHGSLRAVLCEVNNTFGERHTYLCVPDHGGSITENEWITAKKLFHVSPFLEREGHYRFRFAIQPEKMGFWIDYHDASGKKQLVTALTGGLTPLTPRSLHRAFWRYPAVCLVAVFRIHWQAARLVMRGIRYIPKPAQHSFRQSRSANITEV
mgnify:CR=1 FL=1